jgi:PKD domain
MKKILLPALLFIFMVGCSAKTSQQGSDSPVKGVRLTLGASPRQGFAPMRVTLHAVLELPSDEDQEYYCLQEEWDFGDGAKSTEQPNCDPFSPGTKVKTEFFTDHMYEKSGTYTVRFMLGDEKIRSRQVSVVVLERPDTPG